MYQKTGILRKVEVEGTYMITSVIISGFSGLSVPSFRLTFSMASSTSSPPTSLPNTVCFLSRWGVALKVTYHWDLQERMGVSGVR